MPRIHPGVLALLIVGCTSELRLESDRDGGAPPSMGGQTPLGASDAGAPQTGQACEVLGTTLCAEDQIYLCQSDADDTAAWSPATPCVSGCLDARQCATCDNECDAVGTARCTDGQVQSCLVQGGCRVWGDALACPAGQCADESECAPCENPCPSPGATRCADGQVSQCTEVSPGCWSWQDTAACSAGCHAAGTACEECDSTCPRAGASACSEGAVRRCERDAKGCLVWSEERTECADGFCHDGTACGNCNNDCERVGDTSCVDGRRSECVRTAEGCRQFGPAVACPDGFCADATTCGECEHACPSLGVTRCTDGQLETCVADRQGCRSWSPPVACDEGFCASDLRCGQCVHACDAVDETVCRAGQRYRCAADANGCRNLVDPTFCDRGYCADDRSCGECAGSCGPQGVHCQGDQSQNCYVDASACQANPSRRCDLGCTDGDCHTCPGGNPVIAELELPMARLDGNAILDEGDGYIAIVTNQTLIFARHVGDQLEWIESHTMHLSDPIGQAHQVAVHRGHVYVARPGLGIRRFRIGTDHRLSAETGGPTVDVLSFIIRDNHLHAIVDPSAAATGDTEVRSYDLRAGNVWQQSSALSLPKSLTSDLRPPMVIVDRTLLIWRLPWSSTSPEIGYAYRIGANGALSARSTWPFPGRIQPDVASDLDGHHLVHIFGTGELVVSQVDAQQNFRALGPALALPDGPVALVARGDRAYAALRNGIVVAVDLSDRAKPRILGETGPANPILALTANDRVVNLLAAVRPGGALRLRLWGPAFVRKLHAVTSRTLADVSNWKNDRLHRYGRFLYHATQSGLRAIDVQNPLAPRHLWTDQRYPHGLLFQHGDYLIPLNNIVDRDETAQRSPLLSLANPNRPQPLASLPASWAAAISGQTLALATKYDGLQFYDLRASPPGCSAATRSATPPRSISTAPASCTWTTRGSGSWTSRRHRRCAPSANTA